MDQYLTGGTVTLGFLIIIVFLIVLAILWFILPFAIFGIKGILREILREIKKENQVTNDNILKMTQELKTLRWEGKFAANREPTNAIVNETPKEKVPEKAEEKSDGEIDIKTEEIIQKKSLRNGGIL